MQYYFDPLKPCLFYPGPDTQLKHVKSTPFLSNPSFLTKFQLTNKDIHTTQESPCTMCTHTCTLVNLSHLVGIYSLDNKQLHTERIR